MGREGRGEETGCKAEGFLKGEKKVKHCYFPGYFAIEVLHKLEPMGKGHDPRVKGMGSKKFRLPCSPSEFDCINNSRWTHSP